MRRRGGICVVVTHRPSALAAVDLILMMAEGRAKAFGPKDEVFRRALRLTPVPQEPGAPEPRPALGLCAAPREAAREPPATPSSTQIQTGTCPPRANGFRLLSQP